MFSFQKGGGGTCPPRSPSIFGPDLYFNLFFSLLTWIQVPILLALKIFAANCSLLLEKLLLLRTNVNVQDQNGNNIFHLILLTTQSEKNCITFLNMLFQHEENKQSYKALMSKRNVDGYCATHIATIKRYHEVIALMHKHGADLNVQVMINSRV